MNSQLISMQEELTAVSEEKNKSEEYLNEEMKKLELIIKENKNNNSNNIKKYEELNNKNKNTKKENDELKIKIMELEDKLYRQEQYMKKRILKDKSNFDINSIETNPLKINLSSKFNILSTSDPSLSCDDNSTKDIINKLNLTESNKPLKPIQKLL